MNKQIDTIPDWADQQLSADLPILRACGESQELEYKEIFPEHVRDLAKEIAAFATSNTGTILLGVSNSGDLVGLEEVDIASGRDQLLRRLEGICAGTVKPSITPTAKFAVEAGKVVLVLVVPKGAQPIYYVGNIPYIRHLTEARPADPHEVVELVRGYISEGVIGAIDEEPDKKQELYSELARILNGILIYADEADDRAVNPWLDMWRSEFGYAASELREIAVQETALEEGVSEELNKLADALNAVASFQLTLGCGQELERLTLEAAKHAEEIKKQRIDSIPLSENSLKQVRELIYTTSRKLEGLTARASNMVDSGQIEDLQSEASGVGMTLLHVAYYNIDQIGVGNIKDNLLEVGHELHLVETMRLYMDGGRSVQAVIDRVSSSSEKLAKIVALLSDVS